MYHDSPEKAVYNRAEQTEAGILKASLMWNTTERWQSPSQGKVLQIQRKHLRVTRGKPDNFSLH